MSIVVWVPLTGLASGLPALTGVASGTPLPANAIAVPEGYDPADPDGLWDLFPTDQEATYAQSYTPIAVATPFNISEAVEGVTLSGGTVQVLTYSLAPVATAVTGVTLSGGTITQTMALDLPAAGVAVAGVAPDVIAIAPAVVDLPATTSGVDAIAPEVYAPALVDVPTAQSEIATVLPDVIGSAIADVPEGGVVVAGVVPVVFAEPTPTLLLHFDGANNSTTITDSSPSARTVTVHGNAKLTTSNPVFGSASAIFDGNGDYMRVASSGGIDLIGDSFTIDCRVRFASDKTNTRICALGGGSAAFNSTNGIHLLVQRLAATGQKRLNVQWWNGTGGVSVTTPIDSLPSLNTWYHISVAVDHAGGLIYTGVGGSVTSHTWTGVRPSTAPIFEMASIPGENGGSTVALNGQIDEMRVVAGVAVYTANFTPPASAYL